jgi:ComF family protein
MEGLANELAAKMSSAEIPFFWRDVEALVPVPMSPERERERGYNPAALLANGLSSKTQIRTKPLLRKTRPTRPQMSLSREERSRNPRGAYQVAEGTILPAKIILVDDVFTTGSTLEECAKVLKKAGAGWVGALVFGRTPRQH